MKKTILLIAMTALLALPALAQTSTDSPSPQAFRNVEAVRDSLRTPIIMLDTAVELQTTAPTGGTNELSGPLAAIPQTGSFTNTTVELGLGAIISATGQGVENVIDAHYNIGQIFFIQAEIENAAGASVVDVIGGGIGFRKAMDTAEVYGRIEGRRNWIPQGGAKPAWELVVGGGAGWMPFSTSSNTILRNGALYAELLGIVSESANRPEMQSEAGLRYLF
jgi:hypothetical protein